MQRLPNTASITAVAPIIVLGTILAGLLFIPIPTPNRDVVMTIVAGLLGYLSRGDKHVPTAEDKP